MTLQHGAPREVGAVVKGDDPLADHGDKDTQHGGTAVVEFDGKIGELSLLSKAVPVKVSVTVGELIHRCVVVFFDIVPDM